MKSRSLHNGTKKRFLMFSTVTWRPFMKYHSPPCFPSRNITRNAETKPPSPPSPLYAWCNYWTAQTIDWNVWGVVKQEIAGLYQFLLGRMKTDIWIRFWFYIFELWDLQNSNLTYFIEVLYFNTGHSKP